MRKFLFLIALFSIQQTSAQTYLISFDGTGESSSVTTVKVENLMKGTTLIMDGNDILRLNITTGIKSIDYDQSSQIRIYPNPVNDYATLQIIASEAGQGVISIVDIGGKAVIKYPVFIGNGSQNFRISGMLKGFYIVNVSGKNYRYSCKFAVASNSTGGVKIEKLTSTEPFVEEKKSKSESKGLQDYVEMEYALGERLKFTGISGIYSTVITNVPNSDETITFKFVECTDGDNTSYPVVHIGSQTWMGENFKTTRYSNGDLIGTTDPINKDITGEISPAYQWPAYGDEGNALVLGRVYTRSTIEGYNNLCPTGWHVPTKSEWNSLFDFLGGISVAGGKLKETGTVHWRSPNTGATNETGFTSIQSGARNGSGAWFMEDILWSSTIDISDEWVYHLQNTSISVFEEKASDPYMGYTVRCLKGERPMTLTTSEIFSVSQTSAQSGGNVIYPGSSNVNSRGVCWNISGNPTIADNHTYDGSGHGNFTSILTGLQVNTRYYIKAHASNSEGTYYGNEIIYSTKGESGTVADMEGNTYQTIKIGTQTWMAENLKSARFLNGDLIPTTPDLFDLVYERYANYQWAYGGDEDNVALYGRLYTWTAATDTRGLCPTGWHVPSVSEWTVLIDYVGGISLAGNKLKEMGVLHWKSPNLGATNESGFTAFPGGIRKFSDGSDYATESGVWWSSTQVDMFTAWRCGVSYNVNHLYSGDVDIRYGFSVRCLKDN